MKKYAYILLIGILIILILFAMCFYLMITSKYVDNSLYLLNNKTICIDAGHGGEDPGKVGTISNEDKINLKIAKDLKAILMSMGANITMTRDSDSGLYANDSSSWSKLNDMKQRRNIIKESNCDIFVSIHMNAHTDNVSKGAQVFYLQNHEQSKLLATKIKAEIDATGEYAKRREIKPRNDLYILKNDNVPSVIVECGFLSEPNEEKKLNDEEYQKQIAKYIAVGIVKYFEGNK